MPIHFQIRFSHFDSFKKKLGVSFDSFHNKYTLCIFIGPLEAMGAIVSKANIVLDTLCVACVLSLCAARGTDGSVCNLAGLSLKTPGTENPSLSHASAMSVLVTEQ